MTPRPAPIMSEGGGGDRTSTTTTTSHRASRFIEAIPDPLQPPGSSDLLFSILSQMDEFEQKRAQNQHHRVSHSSSGSWGSGSGSRSSAAAAPPKAPPHVSRVNSGSAWLKTVKAMGIRGRLMGLVKTNGT